MPPSKTNLTPDASLFVGREAETQALAARLEEGTRLVTLIGPPGIGKTRLARHFAAGRLREFGRVGAGGVWFCDLTEARTATDVITRVAHTLELPGARGEADDEAARLGHGLAARGRLLLVLDNLEQVLLPACDVLAAWLERAPRLVVLATSRERLRLPDEAICELEPLPDDHAVALFIERARRARPGYTPDDPERAAIAEIVQRLEGIPLALELAAARMSVLTPEGMLRRVSRRFELLGNVRRGTRDRQATLWGAIEWSWDLLEPWEQAALAQCAVFRGGFTLDAAEHVLEVAAAHPDAPWTVDIVQALRDKSLLRTWAPDGRPGQLRFGFYESIREFAARQLASLSGDAGGSVEDRHAAWFIEQGARWSAGVFHSEGPRGRELLTLEAENLVAAVERCLEGGPEALDPARRGLLALDPILTTRGPYDTHRRLLDRALADPGSGDPAAVARLLAARGNLHRRRGRAHEALTDLEQARARAATAEVRDVEAAAAADLGIVHHEQGRLEEARAHYDAALKLSREVGDRRTEGRALGSLAILQNELGGSDDAQILYERALTIFRLVGDRHAEAIFLCNLGDLHQEQRRPSEARAHYEQSLAILHELGDRRVQGVVLGNLGGILQEQGAFEEAWARRNEALSVLRQVGDRRLEGIFGGYLGALELERGRSAEAIEHLTRAMERVHRAGDKRFEGLFLAFLGVAEAGRDRIDAAAAAFDGARALLGDLGDRLLLAALDVHAAHLDLARARAGRVPLALERVRRHLREADEQAEQSEEVRLALRLYKGAVQAQCPDALAAEPAAPNAPALVVDPDGRGFTPPDEDRIDLGRRRALRLIVQKLATYRMTAAGRALSLDDLLEAGWPGERVLPEAGANRVYVAVATLRKLGLRDLLLSRDDGYLLDPAVDLRYSEPLTP